MNTTANAHVRSASAQQTIQTALLVVLTIVGTWLALYRVPWQVSADPCLIAALGSIVIVVCLWLMRWRGSTGVISERYMLAGLLVAMPLVYVARYLFASTSRGAGYWLWVEVLGTIIFVALAVLGLKRSPWFLAVGMVLRGLAWDAWHYRNSTYMPDWYAFAAW